MHHKEELSLRKFLNRFPTEESCEEYLFQQKWPDGFICPKCGCREFYHIKGRKKPLKKSAGYSKTGRDMV